MSPAPWSRPSTAARAKLKLLYPDDMPLFEKIRTIAKEIYRAKDVDRRQGGARPTRPGKSMGYGKPPVCIAKTQYSFSTNADAKGAPTGITHPGARGAAVGRRGVRGGGLRRDHDHAGPAARAGRRTRSTSARTERSSGCSSPNVPSAEEHVRAADVFLQTRRYVTSGRRIWPAQRGPRIGYRFDAGLRGGIAVRGTAISFKILDVLKHDG